MAPPPRPPTRGLATSVRPRQVTPPLHPGLRKRRTVRRTPEGIRTPEGPLRLRALPDADPLRCAARPPPPTGLTHSVQQRRGKLPPAARLRRGPPHLASPHWASPPGTTATKESPAHPGGDPHFGGPSAPPSPPERRSPPLCCPTSAAHGARPRCSAAPRQAPPHPLRGFGEARRAWPHRTGRHHPGRPQQWISRRTPEGIRTPEDPGGPKDPPERRSPPSWATRDGDGPRALSAVGIPPRTRFRRTPPRAHIPPKPTTTKEPPAHPGGDPRSGGPGRPQRPSRTQIPSNVG